MLSKALTVGALKLAIASLRLEAMAGSQERFLAEAGLDLPPMEREMLLNARAAYLYRTPKPHQAGHKLSSFCCDSAVSNIVYARYSGSSNNGLSIRLFLLVCLVSAF